MAEATITNVFSNKVDSLASEVNTNFSDLTTFLNNSVIQLDGSINPTANLSLAGNRVVDLAAASDSTDAAQKAYIDSFKAVSAFGKSGSAASSNRNLVTGFDTVINDPNSMVNFGTDDGLFTIPSDGFYIVMPCWYQITSINRTLFQPTINDHRIDDDSRSDPKSGLRQDSSSGSNHYYIQIPYGLYLYSGDEFRLWTDGTATYYDLKLYFLRVVG